MNQNKIRCQVCHEEQIKYHHDACRRCYSQKVNRRAFEKISGEFRSASEYNAKIYKIFVSDFDNRHIKNADLPVAKRFAAYLTEYRLEQILSWQDIFDLSERANIRYTNHASHGCAFKRVGRAMEKLGMIGRSRDARITQFTNLMISFPEELRPLIKEFYQDVASAHKRTSSVLKILVSVNVFHQFIKKSLLKAGTADADRFIATLNHYSTSHFTERVRSLNRFYAWTHAKGLCSENPFINKKYSYLQRQCLNCGVVKYFWTSNEYCDECYKNILFKKKNSVLIAPIQLQWDYNQHLLGLYQKYINRYKMRGRHVQSTKLLIKFLQATELKPLRSWLDVGRSRQKFMLFHHLSKAPRGGCPIEKIAYVLQELGVLPIREEDHTIYLESALEHADKKIAVILREYLQGQRRQRRSYRALCTSFRMIHDFYLWLNENACDDIFAASEILAREYILSVPTQDRSGVLRNVLNKFYRWAIFKKKTIYNPFAGIESVKSSASIEICSSGTIKKLERFIKCSTSDPESAFILCLILYFGFTATDLAMATVDMNKKQLSIIFHRGELSYGYKIHKRDQVLSLPTDPDWIFKLQNRYKVLWQERFKKIKQDFPLSPLLLRSDSRHGRSLRTLAVRDRVKAATNSAVGFAVPISVIRRTGAHVYSQQVDAAILPQFGWSVDYSFDFVWRQRRFFTPNNK